MSDLPASFPRTRGDRPYATQKRDSLAPNAMWLKRPYGQLAKCAEAQALRKAFPEFGSQPTSDEMEGKELGDSSPRVQQKKAEMEIKQYTDEQIAQNASKWLDIFAAGKSTADDLVAAISSRYSLDDDQIEAIRDIEKQAKGGAV